MKTLQEWAQLELNSIEKFVEYWQNQSNKDQFPESLPDGDWDEQFSFFCESVEK